MTQFSYIRTESGESVTAYIGEDVYVADDSHPNFNTIRETALAWEELTPEMFSVGLQVGQTFAALTERVSVSGGHVYFDAEKVDNSIAAQIVRFLSEGVEDWKPLVRFLEKVQDNPQQHSREQLYDWLARREFTITASGDIIGYKGVQVDPEGNFTSINQGTAIVNGEVYRGNIPNFVGAVVEMPRNEVQHDPSIGCHIGLHVGTYQYAESFARGALLEVTVNPRDVVSVPTDSDWAKVRVCRYRVIGTIDAPHTVPVVFDEDYLDPEDECHYADGCDCDCDC